jgi:hypothetical protein
LKVQLPFIVGINEFQYSDEFEVVQQAIALDSSTKKNWNFKLPLQNSDKITFKAYNMSFTNNPLSY